MEHRGFTIAKSLTAKNCAQCHATEYEQLARSRHAAPSWAAVNGAKDMTPEQRDLGERYHKGSVDRPPMTIGPLERPAALASGCNACRAIGKPNADGSFGTCTNCHARHAASLALAREPSTCGQCHMGPEHSQIEIYGESKHGALFAAQRERFNLAADPKHLTAKDMSVPTCATCHMSGLEGMKVTHDPAPERRSRPGGDEGGLPRVPHAAEDRRLLCEGGGGAHGAHLANELARRVEWAPIVFSAIATPLLVPVALGSERAVFRHVDRLVAIGASPVGVAGMILHHESGFCEKQTLHDLVYSAPFVAPVSYVGVGLLLLLVRSPDADGSAFGPWILALTLVRAPGMARAIMRACTVVMILEVGEPRSAPRDDVARDRFVFGAPAFAPLLFANAALLAVIGLGACRRSAPETPA